MRAVIYCHREWSDNPQQWELRRRLCCQVGAKLGLRDSVEAEDFETLQRLCLREGYNHVVVPSSMHTPPHVLLWLKRQRVRIHDALQLISKLG